MSKYYVREDDVSRDKVMGPMMMTVRANTAQAQSNADGDFSPLITDTNGKLHVNASGLALGAPADGTYIGDIKFGEALPAGSATIGKLAANSGVDIGDVDVTSLPSLPSGSNAIGSVTLGAGSAAIGKLAANSGVDIGDVDVTSLPASTNTLEVVGDVAEAATAAGNPVLIGGKAKEMDGTDPGVVAENQAVALRTDLSGRLLVSTDHPRRFSVTESATSSQTDNELVAAPGAGLSIYITDVTIGMAAAGAIALQDQDDAYVVAPMGAAGAGVASMSFSVPVKVAENKALEWDSTVGGTVLHGITVTGYIAKTYS